jgi:hypothetical protein
MPDHHAYLLPAIAALLLLGVAGLAALRDLVAEARPASARLASAGLIAVVVLLIPAQLVAHAGRSSLCGAYASDEVARWELLGLPPRAVLLVSYFETSYRIMALRATEQARPDVAILDLGFLTYPGMAGESALRHPELAPVIDAPLRLGAPLPLAELGALAPRPVQVQLQPELDRAAAPLLLPVGPFAHLAPRPPTREARARGERADVMLRRALGNRLAEPHPGDRVGSRNALLWHDFNRLRFYCLWIAPTAWNLTEDSLLEVDCSFAAMPLR